MWERFSEHAPTVALAAATCGLIAAAIEARNAARLATPPGCIRLLWRAGSCGASGFGGAGIFAAAIVESMPASPWVVVGLSAAVGIAIDISTRAGIRRLFRLLLRLNLSIAKTLSDDDLT